MTADEAPRWRRFVPDVLKSVTPAAIENAVAEIADRADLFLGDADAFDVAKAVANELRVQATVRSNPRSRAESRAYFATAAMQLIGAAADMDRQDAEVAKGAVAEPPAPIPMLLTCPAQGCGARHVDAGAFATKPHHTHACQECGHCWRPAIGHTVGVRFLPGFKNESEDDRG